MSDLKIPVQSLARLRTGDILPLTLPVNALGSLVLEGAAFFAARPTRQGNHKAMQLVECVNVDPETGNMEKEGRVE